MQMKGYKMIKDLAEQGHPDGMCYYGKAFFFSLTDFGNTKYVVLMDSFSFQLRGVYCLDGDHTSVYICIYAYTGIILNEGLVEGIDASPEKAVVWWSRCCDFHQHIWSTYELAVALYTGEGVPEDTVRAVSLFRKAAHLGHAGAAYMLGELLLDGVGVSRDRASALEWIVTAAELGHYKARQRILAILQQDWADLELGNAQADEEEETIQWSSMSDEEKANAILIERRYTIGGGSRNPEVLHKRKTKVSQSKEEN
jgi:TPR repeat protein